MSTSWDHAVKARAHLRFIAMFLFAMALAATVARFWVPALQQFPIILALLGMQAFSNASLLARVADLQAALDMKRIAREIAGGQQEPVHVIAGDQIAFNGLHWVSFNRSVIVSFHT